MLEKELRKDLFLKKLGEKKVQLEEDVFINDESIKKVDDIVESKESRKLIKIDVDVLIDYTVKK